MEMTSATAAAARKRGANEPVFIKPKDKEEKELESFLFGHVAEDDDAFENVGHELSQDEQEGEAEENQGDELFFFDSGPGYVVDSEPAPVAEEKEAGSDKDVSMDEDDASDESESESETDTDRYGYGREPAWEDDDDARLQVSLASTDRLRKLRRHENEDIISGAEYERRLRVQHEKIYPRPNWAKLPSEKNNKRRRRSSMSSDESDHDGDDDGFRLDDETRLDLLKSTYGILEQRKQSRNLPSNFIDILRVKDANQASRSSDSINVVEFHPNAQVMMSCSYKTLQLFQVDGKVNPKIQSMYFKDMPVLCAKFHPSGEQIIASGRRHYYYIYDVQSGTVDRCPGIWGRKEKSLEKFSISPCGRYIAFLGANGHIILVSNLTKQYIGALKHSASVFSADWSSDGKYLFSIGLEGEIFQWDVGQRECINKWYDDGSLRPFVLSASPDSKYYAIGSSSGVVNLYDQSVLDPETYKPTPLKAIMNLTTPITGIRFNHDSQLMAISSSHAKNQFKLVHVPTGGVFSNWPTERTPLGYVSAFSFSPNSDYLAIGNRKGRVLLYTLKHYAL